MDSRKRSQPGPSRRSTTVNPPSNPPGTSAGSRKTSKAIPPKQSGVSKAKPVPKSILKDKNRVEGGVEESTNSNNRTRRVNSKTTKSEKDNEVHSFYPFGLPEEMQEKDNFLVYKWDNTKGKERNARDPVNKPLAQPVDDAYLGVIPTETADIAWEHLATDKKKHSLEDYIGSVPGGRQAEPLIPKEPLKEAETETNAPVIDPSHSQPPPRPNQTISPPPPPEEDEDEEPPEQIEPIGSTDSSEPRKSIEPKRRTLVERTADYKRNNRCCSPVKVECIHSPCCLDRGKKASPTWQLCWDCGLTYRKIPPPTVPDAGLFCKAGRNQNGEPCGSGRTTAAHPTTAVQTKAGAIQLKAFPVKNVYQRPKLMTALPMKESGVKPAHEETDEVSNSGSDDTISDSDVEATKP